MPGGLIDIISYGTQELFLTGTPEISFFKSVYRRYTNYSIESFEIPFDNEVGFGLSSEVTLRPIGDLINKIYLKIKIPRINFKRQVAFDTLRNYTNYLNKLYSEYQRYLLYMNVNANAYRAAIEIYTASNIIYSEEMVDAILKVYDAYSTTISYASSISWFNINCPIKYIEPHHFNLLIIANGIKEYYNTGDIRMDPLLLKKESFKVILDKALSLCQKIQEYYENQIHEAILKQNDETNLNYKFAWVNRLGHSIIDYIDIYIGNDRIDRQYGNWLDIWYELAGKKDQNEIYMKMIGNVPELTNFDRNEKPEYSLYIPLQFWFNRFNGLSLPILALQHSDVKISVKLRNFSSCAYIERKTDIKESDDAFNLDDLFNNDLSFGSNRILEASLIVDYIFLDRSERRKFARSSHEYLIDQIQTMHINDIEDEKVQVKLDFNHPCKEIIWVLQKQSFINNRDGHTKCRWNNFTPNKNNKGFSIEYASLDFNGYPRVDRFKAMYYNYLQPYEHHSNTPSDGINVYSFALLPEEQQPSGSCNFTRIKRSILNLWINPDMFSFYESDKTDENINFIDKQEKCFTKLDLWIFVISHNILRIAGGTGAVAFI